MGTLKIINVTVKNYSEKIIIFRVVTLANAEFKIDKVLKSQQPTHEGLDKH